MNESDLITQARLGNEAAFTRLVELYQTGIYNLCYRMLGDSTEAEEAAQETFLRAYTQLRRFDIIRSFKTWLFSIAHHYCIDCLRKRHLIWLSIDRPFLEAHPALREPDPEPEAALVQREQQVRIAGLLAKLTPEDRSVVIMRYWHELSYEEIAEATGATVSAVKSRLHRARASLANLLRPAVPEPAGRLGPSLVGAGEINR